METGEIFELIERFDKSTLSEMIVARGDERITLRKATSEYAQFQHPQAGASAMHASALAAHERSIPEAAAETLAEAEEIITSPIVGTFYRAISPDSPPYVESGKKVTKGETICVLEAMKVMNELVAEFDCEVIDVLVENGAMVEFGTPLFKVKR